MIAHPIEAVTHPDPYPYYDELAIQPLAWNHQLGMWVAAGADDVRAVLGHPAVRVRPPDAEIPSALAGATAGETFGRLVRMNDRDERAAVKDAIVRALALIDAAAVNAAAARATEHLAPSFDSRGDFIDRWITDFPIAAVAHLVGIEPSDLAVAIPAARDIGACFGSVPPPDARTIARRATAVLAGLAAMVRCRHCSRQPAPAMRSPTPSGSCSRPWTRWPASSATRCAG